MNNQTDATEDEMKAWGIERIVRASVIRDILRGQLAKNPDPLGLRLHGARIDGRLDLRYVQAQIPLELSHCFIPAGGTLSNASLVSLDMRWCCVEQSLELEDTRIGGQLIAKGVTIRNDSGPALVADHIRVNQGMYLVDGFSATGTGEEGAVKLNGAHIGGPLIATDATITNDCGPALSADNLQVGHELLFSGFTAAGAGERGAVKLNGAHIGGQLSAIGATTITNDSGPALIAERIQVEQDLSLNGFTATGAREKGTVRLLGAHIGGQLDATGVITITNDSGPALTADSIRVGHSVYLVDQFSATGAGVKGAVRLSGAQIGGQVSAVGAIITNKSGPALTAESIQVKEDLNLLGFTATGASQQSVVKLNGARLGELFLDLADIRDTAGRPGMLNVDGLTYGRQPKFSTVTEWLAALADRTPYYSAQPYQQLAAASRAAGHDGATRKILMAQRRDQIRRRAVTAFPERAWAKTTGFLLGYGYQPWRALIGLVTIVVAAIALSVIAGGHYGGLSHTARAIPPDTPCSTIEQVGVGIDLGLPLIKTTTRDTCTTTPTHAGQVITASGWVLQTLAWALATLFVAGFTGAVRKT